MVGTTSPNTANATYLRKIRKPLVEKMRRDRMNSSLAQLKTILAVNIKQSSTSAMARLDKADILEITVSHLMNLQHQHKSASLARSADGYKKGFEDCARDAFNYLTSTRDIDGDSLRRVNHHLHSCYVEKTQSGAISGIGNLHPEDVPSAHVRTRQTVHSAGVFSRGNFYTTDSAYNIQQKASVTPCYQGFFGKEQCYNGQAHFSCSEHNDIVDTSLNSTLDISLGSSSSITPQKEVPHDPYNRLNGSVDTSLNSSCSMSLDSSYSITPEKVVPHVSYNRLNESVDTSLNTSCNMSLDSSSSLTPAKVVPGLNKDDNVWRPW